MAEDTQQFLYYLGPEVNTVYATLLDFYPTATETIATTLILLQ